MIKVTESEKSTILGLTGSIGSGKTFVSSLLAQTGARIICADEIAREVAAPGSPALSDIRHRFGSDVFHEDGSLDREKLGRLVFSDPARRRELEEIIHPLVRKRELDLLKEYDGHPLVVLDVPLLFENNLDRYCDHTVAVTITEEERQRRLGAARGLTREQVEARLRAQMAQEEKAARADTVIDNSGSREATARQVNALLATLFPGTLPEPLRFFPAGGHSPAG